MVEREHGYSWIYVGATPLYEVYEAVLYAPLIEQPLMTQALHDSLRAGLTHARRTARKLWIAINLGELPSEQMVAVFYHLCLPFIGTPLVTRAFNLRGARPEQNQDYRLVLQIIQAAFENQFVADRAAALPPDLLGAAEAASAKLADVRHS